MDSWLLLQSAKSVNFFKCYLDMVCFSFPKASMSGTRYLIVSENTYKTSPMQPPCVSAILNALYVLRNRVATMQLYWVV